MRAKAICEINWVDQSETGSASHTTPCHLRPSHYHTLHRELNNFVWFRLLFIEAMYCLCDLNKSLFLCILGFLLYFNLPNRLVRLVALYWVHFQFFIYSVFIFTILLIALRNW